MTNHKQMMSRLLCFFGFHRWRYKLSEVGYVPLKGWPFGTTCQHCHKPHPRPLPINPTETP
jgi:hypothetical protein